MTRVHLRWLAGLLVAAFTLGGCGLADLKPKPEPMPPLNHWSPGLLGLSGYGAAGLGPNGYPNVEDEGGELEPVQQFLASVGLQPADLPSGVELRLVPKGDRLSGTSLDFCGADYPSEPLRLVRREVAAMTAAGEYAGLTSQMVQYESPEAALQALDELLAAKSACPDGTTYTDESGDSHTLAFAAIDPPADVELMPQPYRVILHFTDSGSLGDFRRFQVYQVRGNTLVAFYASGSGTDPFNSESQEFLFNLVSRLTGRLNAADPLDIGEYW